MCGVPYIIFLHFHCTLVGTYCFVYCMFSFHVDAHVPVTTVQLGEPVTFTCPLPNTQVSHRKLHWYKQSAGDTLKVIVTLKKPASTQYAPGFSESRLKVNYENNFSNLTILRTIQEDEGMYHCEVTEWTAATVWSGTYLLLKGNLMIYFHSTQSYTVLMFKKKKTLSIASLLLEVKNVQFQSN